MCGVCGRGVCDYHLDKNLGKPDLPVMPIPLEHSSTDLLASGLEVTNIGQGQPRNEHSVTLHKLMEGVTDGITSTADSDQSDCLQVNSSNNYNNIYVQCLYVFLHIID